MSTRRRFISLLPLAGVSALAACSDKRSDAAAPAPTSPAPAPTAAPAPAPPQAAAPAPAAAPTGGALDPQDPQALALGYVAVADKIDKAKYPNYAPGQQCANCALFQGKAGDASGPCPIFAGKAVLATGLCSAYAKKA